MKVKLFTHTDLDGVGCSIIGQHVFRHIDVEYCDYHNVNQIIQDFILISDNLNAYDRIFITDISVNEATAEMIESLDAKNKFCLLDHHRTTLWMNQYDWCIVEEYLGDYNKQSGTTLFTHYLESTIGFAIAPIALDFAELVRQYDTWEWKNIYKDEKPKQLNDLLKIYGRKDFLESMKNYLVSNKATFEFTDEDTLLLTQRDKEIKRYMSTKEKQMIHKTLMQNNITYKVGVVFAEDHLSELGNFLAERNKDLDFVMMMNPSYNSISLRGVHENIDLGAIAKEYGGGGHPMAAGMPMSIKAVRFLYDMQFNQSEGREVVS